MGIPFMNFPAQIVKGLGTMVKKIPGLFFVLWDYLLRRYRMSTSSRVLPLLISSK